MTRAVDIRVNASSELKDAVSLHVYSSSERENIVL